MDRRNAAQRAQRHVERLPGVRQHGGQERHRRVVDIGQHADPVALIQPPGDLRDVGRGIAVAQIRLQPRLALLRKHLAMAGLVEAIDHDPVVAGQAADDAGRLVAQRPQGRGLQHPAQPVLDLAGAVRRQGRPFQLHDQAAMRGAVQHGVERGPGRADAAAHGERHRAQQRHVEMRADTVGEVAVDGVDGAADRVMREAQERRRVGAGLDDDMAAFPQHQQGAVRLDRPGEVDLLPLAVRKVGLAERGHSGRGRQRLASPCQPAGSAPPSEATAAA